MHGKVWCMLLAAFEMNGGMEFGCLSLGVGVGSWFIFVGGF